MAGDPRGRVPEAACGFDRAAPEYERSRPDYPVEVIDLLAAELPLRPRTRVLDLAAGTGKLTRGLVRTGAQVVAVEPIEGMRRQLQVMCPDVEVLDGTAEDIPLPDDSVDAATVAQAFHWFDARAALAELSRVLRPRGGLALVWNVRDESVPWLAGMSRVLAGYTGGRAGYRKGDWQTVLAESGLFGPVTRHVHRWEQPMTRERLADRVRSISYVAASSEADRETAVGAVLALVADLPESFAMPYVTEIFCCHMP